METKRRGRKAITLTLADGTEVPGLYRKPGTNVYRIRATNQEFTEADERLAVMKFRKLTATPADVVTLPGRPQSFGFDTNIDTNQVSATSDMMVEIDSPEFWLYVREMLITKAAYVAERNLSRVHRRLCCRQTSR
jgi:hypothetical protein